LSYLKRGHNQLPAKQAVSYTSGCINERGRLLSGEVTFPFESGPLFGLKAYGTEWVSCDEP